MIKDSIDKNLEFKLTLFAGLLGAWWWILHFASKFDLVKEGAFFFDAFTLISFIFFYPLINLLLMLIYTFIFQKGTVKEKELQEKYDQSSKRFYSWLALLFLILPLCIFLLAFADIKIITSIIVSIIYLSIICYFFVRFFSNKDFGQKLWVFAIWLSGYALVFEFVYAFARTFGKMNLL